MTAEPTAAEIEAAARALWTPRSWSEAKAESGAALAAVLPLVEARLQTMWRGVQCWCGSEVGARTPGDANGLGCLAVLEHEWRRVGMRPDHMADPRVEAGADALRALGVPAQRSWDYADAILRAALTQDGD